MIQLFKSFCVYIKVLSTIREFTIQSIFRIYNRFFDHLKRNKTQFYRKEIFWKKSLINALKTTKTKLSKYYNQTQNDLELLYDKITLVHFIVEDALFNSSKWKIKSKQKTWQNVYWNALKKIYNEYKQQTSDISTSRWFETANDVWTLNEILDDDHLFKNVENEFQKYRRQNEKNSFHWLRNNLCNNHWHFQCLLRIWKKNLF